MTYVAVVHLCRQTLQELVKFADDEKVVLLADEVYQENIYQDERPFVSARKVRQTQGGTGGTHWRYTRGRWSLQVHT